MEVQIWRSPREHFCCSEGSREHSSSIPLKWKNEDSSPAGPTGILVRGVITWLLWRSTISERGDDYIITGNVTLDRGHVSLPGATGPIFLVTVLQNDLICVLLDVGSCLHDSEERGSAYQPSTRPAARWRLWFWSLKWTMIGASSGKYLMMVNIRNNSKLFSQSGILIHKSSDFHQLLTSLSGQDLLTLIVQEHQLIHVFGPELLTTAAPGWPSQHQEPGTRAHTPSLLRSHTAPPPCTAAWRLLLSVSGAADTTRCGPTPWDFLRVRESCRGRTSWKSWRETWRTAEKVQSFGLTAKQPNCNHENEKSCLIESFYYEWVHTSTGDFSQSREDLGLNLQVCCERGGGFPGNNYYWP